MKPHITLIPFKDTPYRWCCSDSEGYAAYGKSPEEAYEIYSDPYTCFCAARSASECVCGAWDIEMED